MTPGAVFPTATPAMAFSRPLYKSRRLRYLTAGVLGTLLLVTGFASADVGRVNDDPKINLMVEQRDCGDSTFVTPMPGHTEFFDQEGVLNVRVVTAGCCCCGGPDIGEGTTGRIIRPGGAVTQTSTPPRGEVLPAREERAPEAETKTETPTETAIGPLPPNPPLGFSPGPAGVAAEPVATSSSRRGFPWWISALALPILFADLGDSPPDGTVCPDDSGLPIGPNRRDCRI